MRTGFRFALVGSALAGCVLATNVGLGQAAPREWRSTSAVGGGGGAPFTARCPRYSYLAGFSGSLGDDLNNVLPLCAKLNPDGSPGRFTVAEVEGATGGNGGTPFNGVCPQETPFVRVLTVSARALPRSSLTASGSAAGRSRAPFRAASTASRGSAFVGPAPRLLREASSSRPTSEPSCETCPATAARRSSVFTGAQGRWSTRSAASVAPSSACRNRRRSRRTGRR